MVLLINKNGNIIEKTVYNVKLYAIMITVKQLNGEIIWKNT